MSLNNARSSSQDYDEDVSIDLDSLKGVGSEFAPPRRKEALNAGRSVPPPPPPPRQPVALPITPPLSPKATQMQQPGTPPPPPPQIPSLNAAAPRATARVISQAPVEEKFRSSVPPKTYQLPSRNTKAPDEQFRSSAPPKSYQSPSRSTRAFDDQFRGSASSNTYNSPSRSSRAFDDQFRGSNPYQSPSRSSKAIDDPFRGTNPYYSPSCTSRAIDDPFRGSNSYHSPSRTSRSPMRASTNSNTRSQSLSPRRSRYDTSPFKSMRSSPTKYDRSPAKSVRGPPRSAMSSSRSVYSLPAPPPMPFYRDGMSFASESEYPLEEIEQMEAEKEAEKSNMRTWFIFLIVGVVLLLIIVGTVMGLAIRQANQDSKPSPAIVVPVPTAPSASPIKATLAPVAPETSDAPVSETAPTTTPQSSAPTMASTNATISDGFTPQFPDLYTRLSTFFTNDKGASISVEGTPQNRAYLWLEEDMVLKGVEPVLDARMAQRYALAVFYFSTNGDTWTRGENWLSTSDECLWQTDALEATSCNGKTSLTSISQLVFDKNNIGGTLPAELSILTNLEIFSVVNDPTGGTKMTGTIPPELGKLTTIREFVIKNHDMNNATIPASLFLEWPRATLVLMERCKLIGKIPTTIGLLTSATKTSFRKNDFTGPIPTEVGQLRKMLQFSVDANRLTGTIPTELGLLVDAKGIWVSQNNLVGPIPNELGNLKLIKAGLRLSDNELTGTIPTSLSTLTDMKNFELENNLLTGPVPDFGALINLSMLNIRDNELTGVISDATCAAIVAGGAEAYADCPGEVACACCMNCPQALQLSSQNSTLRGRMTK